MNIEIISNTGTIFLKFYEEENGIKMMKAITKLLERSNNGVITYHDEKDILILSKEFLQTCLIRIPKKEVEN